MPMDVGIHATSKYLLGNLIPGAEQNITRTISLYRFLLQNKDVDPNALRLKILDKGKPLFSEGDLREIMEVVKRNAGMPFSRQLLTRNVQRGGANAAATVPPTVAPAAPVAGAPAAPGKPGGAGEFWDSFFEKLAHPIASRIPSKFDGLIWYIFILQHLEEIDFLGPIISTALDSITLTLPILAQMAKSVAMRVLMLAPVPYAGVAGELLGTGVATMILSVAIFLNASRKKFGSAFKVALEAIPLFGEMLADMAKNFETAALRYERNRRKMLNTLEKYSPHVEDVVDYWSPTVEIQDQEMVFFDVNKMKLDLINKAAQELGIDDAMSIVGNSALPTIPSAAAAGAVGMAALSAATPGVMPNAATGTAPAPTPAPAPNAAATAAAATAPKKRKTRKARR
jgi:hypothetical protein